jgi:CubicO group peptidase (beta-lactamase class C family)
VTRLLACSALVLCSAAPLAAQTQALPPDADPRFAQVDSLFAAFDRDDAPGYAVGIVRDGRLAYARGFGMADLDHGVRIAPTSVFNVASLSKQFTAACAAILVRRGLVDLDAPVRRYVEEFPARFGEVTVAHLVYMTSGLPEYYTLERPGGRSWGDDFFTNDDAIAATLAQPSLRFEPGTQWAYNNVGYMLLAEIVERVSGVPFAEFARREIFQPLGMASTRFDVDLGAVVPGRVTGYNATADGGWRRELRRAPHYGGSGLLTTVEDLARWNRSFETHALGGPELTELLLSTRRFAHDKANDAFGLVWGEFRGRRTLWYEGGDAGFSSYMVRLPDERLTVIVLSNLGTGNAAQHGRRILELLVR